MCRIHQRDASLDDDRLKALVTHISIILQLFPIFWEQLRFLFLWNFFSLICVMSSVCMLVFVVENMARVRNGQLGQPDSWAGIKGTGCECHVGGRRRNRHSTCSQIWGSSNKSRFRKYYIIIYIYRINRIHRLTNNWWFRYRECHLPSTSRSPTSTKRRCNLCVNALVNKHVDLTTNTYHETCLIVGWTRGEGVVS